MRFEILKRFLVAKNKWRVKLEDEETGEIVLPDEGLILTDGVGRKFRVLSSGSNNEGFSLIRAVDLKPGGPVKDFLYGEHHFD